MDLHPLVQKAVKAGGINMTPARKKAVFNRDARLAKNVFLAIEYRHIGKAIKEGVLTDHRVIEEIVRAGEIGARILLQTEENLGRKLPRSRAKKLISIYLRIRDVRNGLATVQRILEGSRMTARTTANA